MKRTTYVLLRYFADRTVHVTGGQTMPVTWNASVSALKVSAVRVVTLLSESAPHEVDDEVYVVPGGVAAGPLAVVAARTCISRGGWVRLWGRAPRRQAQS